MKSKTDFTGQRFGSLVATRRIGMVKGVLIWECLCDCGAITSCTLYNLLAGRTKSCGCGQGKVDNLHNSQWKGYAEISGRYWNSLIYSANRRGISFDLSMTDAWEQFVQQDKKCALSGTPLIFGKNQTASLDRIVSELGYNRDNIQWLHKDVNNMKSKFPQEYFCETCCKIADRYRSGQIS